MYLWWWKIGGVYLTQITNLDPISYDLLFERFLNPARISMPDIDLDFADMGKVEIKKPQAKKAHKAANEIDISKKGRRNRKSGLF